MANKVMGKPIEKWQIKRIQTIISAKKLQQCKLDLFDSVANGRIINSTKDLYYEEANRLINVLNKIQYNSAANRMRRKIISCCRECGFSINGKADMARIEAWVKKYGYLADKGLNDYTPQELPTLVTQADKMRDSFIKGI